MSHISPAPDLSIVPSTGVEGATWPSHFVLPQGASGQISSAGWTVGNEGFIQQTFLGASIRSFNLTAGFGDTSSQLSVDLVDDEFNKSDETPAGQGDDVYHSGLHDRFYPPVVGSPVFFKFGKNPATIEQAWRKTFDDTYNYITLPSVLPFSETTYTPPLTNLPAHHFVDVENNKIIDKSPLWDINTHWRGKDHFVFGGILQSYNQTKGGDGNPLFSASIVDPRELLSNVTVLLNNYQGSTYGQKNLMNVYGFLEYDLTDVVQSQLDSQALSKEVLRKTVNNSTGEVFYIGTDLYKFPINPFSPLVLPENFPITGQGFSRRSNQGIPWYRVEQGIRALFNFDGFLPQEYVDAGFGGAVDFRGYKYVVDFSGIPTEKISKMYFLDFDQMTLMELAQELCDVISHDLFVSLLPVIDHPACKFIYDYNQDRISAGDYSNIITGIIRVDTIDKSQQPRYGAIKDYLDDIRSDGVYVTNEELGYESANITTDKMVVGGQEVEMYYFTANGDRDDLELRKKNYGLTNTHELLQAEQWLLSKSLEQQILPFYGFLGKNALSIPRGWGSYQQILLDTTGLDAFGVGNYYVATEMELRYALISYERWARFLANYNELFMEEVGEDKQLWMGLAGATTSQIPGFNNFGTDTFNLNELVNREFAVSVPRCVFNSDRPYMGDDGYPASPCSPPYGYPLYYKRAEKIGIPEVGIVGFTLASTECITNAEQLKKTIAATDQENTNKLRNLIEQENKISSEIQDLRKIIDDINNSGQDDLLSSAKRIASNFAIELCKRRLKSIAENISTINNPKITLANLENLNKNNSHFRKQLNKLSRQGLKNAHKVYDFIRSIAEENLGKKFLVKIPKKCNLNYTKELNVSNYGEILNGPFGFKPIFTNINIGYQNQALLNSLILSGGSFTYGALKGNYNVVNETWDFNYKPEPQGGFFNFALFDRNLSFSEMGSLNQNQLPLATQHLLCPKDLTNFIEDNGRIHCYVRYDHSQFLNLSSVDKNSVAQEKITSSSLVPDILEEINNLNPSQGESFSQIVTRTNSPDAIQPAVAFVKCSLDEQLYMPPKIGNVTTQVFGRTFMWHPNITQFKTVETEDINGCTKLVASQGYPLPIFGVGDNGGSDGTFVTNQDFNRIYNQTLNGLIIDTEKHNLDSNHVYALITVPGRITPTIDSRWRDAVYQLANGARLKHILTQDVVRGPLGFERPAPIMNKRVDLCDTHEFTFKQLNVAQKAQRASLQNLSFSNPEISVEFSQPSPVYPDLVALPLMSQERCYGPWMSASIIDDSRVRYSNIGGKIEFVKNENLTPWNYAGYQLMNEAGALEAQFSNSLLLFSEHGSFTMTEAPTGISLAKALINEGPLVTSINVSIGNQVTTSVNMSLYTSRFGKLQKQKEYAIARITRERQKIIDQNNALTRKGFGKSATGSDIFSKNAIAAAGGQAFLYARDQSSKALSSLEKGQTVFDKLVYSTNISENSFKEIGGAGNVFPIKEYHTTAAIQSPGYLEETMGLVEEDNNLRELERKTTAVNMKDMFVPYDQIPDSPYVASVPYINKAARDQRFS